MVRRHDAAPPHDDQTPRDGITCLTTQSTLPLSVLHAFAPSNAGGLPRVVEGLTIGQRGLGYRVDVAAIVLDEAPQTTGIARMAQAGVTIHPLRIRERGYLRERNAFLELCHRVKPDVVHTHGVRTDVVDGTAAHAHGFPTLTTLHGRTGGGLKWRAMEWLQYGVIQRFDAVVAVSQPQVDYLMGRGIAADRIHLVANAWAPNVAPLGRADARRALGAAGEVPLIGWVGRLSPEKGADVFIEALAQLRDVAYQVAILGDGSVGDAVKTRATALGLDDRVRWLGTMPDAGRLFEAFDLFVLSSRTEGTPIALFEAMAAEVPIVSTRVGGVPAVISPKEAILVPSEDPPALARAIEAVIADPATARERASHARQRLTAAYGTAPWLDQYDSLYRMVSARTNRVIEKNGR